MTRRDFMAGAACASLGLAAGCRAVPEAPRANPELEAAMRDYVARGLFGCIVCASNRGDLACAGPLTLAADSPPATPDALFDLASVSKTQTAALCALLAAEGRLDVDAPFTEYLPEHVLAKENCRITVRDLATHSGGFDNAKPYRTPDPVRHFAELYAKRPVWPRGERFEYACSNFVYLGLIVEKLTGLDLDRAARKLLWGPLGMDATTWFPVVGSPNAVEYAPSTYTGPARRIGERIDSCAYFAPRPMGNACCFSTGPDMLKFCTDLLRRERFPRAYYDLQLTPSFTGDGHRRSFGWDMTAPKSTFSDWVRTGFSDVAVCHTGYTGSVIAVDPARDFAGVAIASQKAGKARTMGPRLHLVDLMA